MKIHPRPDHTKNATSFIQILLRDFNQYSMAKKCVDIKHGKNKEVKCIIQKSYYFHVREIEFLKITCFNEERNKTNLLYNKYIVNCIFM